MPTLAVLVSLLLPALKLVENEIGIAGRFWHLWYDLGLIRVGDRILGRVIPSDVIERHTRL